MNCPVCGGEMQRGGLVTRVGFYSWLPADRIEINYSALSTLINGKALKGKTKFLSQQTKIPSAFYCEKCKKVVGIFEVDE
jgi:hypothetical protein